MKSTTVVDESLRIWIACACLSFAGVDPSTAAADPATKGAKPHVVLTGTKSHIKERSCVRVTSAEQWVALWQRHMGKEPAKEYDEFYNPAGVPGVDLENCMVIAVFQGEGANNAGLKAVSLQEEGDRIVFRFMDKSYQTMNKIDDVAVYGFFVLPWSSKTVIVEENHQTLIGKPPIWNERARFGNLPSGPKK